MPTLLVTDKMSPELAARVAARVSGRRVRSGSARGRKPRTVLLVRLAMLAAIVVLVAGIASARRASRLELQSERAELLSMLGRKASLLTASDRRLVGKVEAVLARAAAGYEGDLLLDELRPPAAFRSLLGRASVYARGTQRDLGRPGHIAEAVAASGKDSFALCLHHPPKDRSEASLWRQVSVAYSSNERLEEQTKNVRMLTEAEAGLPFLSESFAQRVKAASEITELRRLRQTFERAPVSRAIDAAKAELLIFVVDEPGDSADSAELDGEKPHAVRVGIVELGSGRFLLRLRKQVDPSFISVRRRSEYARGLDSCRLAFDVHDAVQGTEAAALTPASP